MPTIFAANESSLMVNGEPVEGVRAIEYRSHQKRQNVYALGSAERIGLVSGELYVEGRIHVVSSSPALDGLAGDQMFNLIAQLRHGETTVDVAFDDCFLMEKSFEISLGGTGEAVYTFTAARIREEVV